MKGSIACRIMLSLLSLWWPHEAFSQVWDDFNDGDFISGVVWSGDTGQFMVNNEILQLNSSGSDSSFLVTPIVLGPDTLEWRFSLRQDFAASSLNYGRFYLSSNSNNLEGPLQGYYLQFGETGSADAIRFFRQNGFTSTLVAKATDSLIAQPFHLRGKVCRFPGGRWQLSVDYAGGENFSEEFDVIDSSFVPAGYFGIKCVYTSSNATKFYLDEVYMGNYLSDTVPPDVVSARLLNDSIIELDVTEESDSLAITNVQHYFINGIGYPNTVVYNLMFPKIIRLCFSPVLSGNGVFTLNVTGLADATGNSMTDTLQLLLFREGIAEVSDIVISEIMSDPTSAPQLPPYEYLELYNRSQKVLVLNGWTIGDATGAVDLPADTLFPGMYRAYTEVANVNAFATVGLINVRGVNGLPSLNNDGDQLELRDSMQRCMDGISYNASMYRNPLKDDRGWSLERTDVLFPCSDRNNWSASRDSSGGTPGRANSVAFIFSDTISPWPVAAFPTDSNTLEIYFSEYPDTISSLNTAYFLGDHNLGSPDTISVLSGKPGFKLHFPVSFLPGTIYTIQIDDQVSDCAGNKVKGWNTVSFALPESIDNGIVLLNEILFNPESDGSDFVEVYNAGETTIDLQELRIAHADPITGIADDVVPFCTQHRLLLPGQYAVASPDISYVHSRYHAGDSRMLIETSLPSFNDDEGIVVLLNGSLNSIETFHYKEKYHFPLLADKEGVSLERISIYRPADDSSNWHSAAANRGYASPCEKNSQNYEQQNDATDWISVEPELFSPDNDGYHDVLGIQCHPPKGGFMVALSVLNEYGLPLRQLTEQELIGTEATWLWDGTDNSGTIVPPGIYILLARLFHLDGETKVVKKACVVAKKI